MPFAIDHEVADPKLLKVSVNVNVPWIYREQLRKAAKKRNVSMNQLLLDAIEAAIPPS